MTSTQAKLLAALLGGTLSRSELREKSGVSSSTSGDIMKVFEQRSWVVCEHVDASTKLMYTITPAGKKALRRYENGEPDEVVGAVAMSRTVVGTERNWVQPAMPYVRNEGHKDLRSYGYGC